MTLKRNILLFVLFSFLSGTPQAVLAENDKIPVLVSIQPQKFFVDKIGGDSVDVTVLIKPGHSPATYEVTPSQMSRLTQAAVYFRIGVPFESAFLPRFQKAAPGVRITDTRQDITLRTMASHHHHGHNCAGHDHADGKDPHIWLDPQLVKIQARTICDVLVALSPRNKILFESNLTGFLSELDGIHDKLKEIMQPHQGKHLVVFHPSWGYFSDAYGLIQRPIELEGKSPPPRQLAAIIRELKPLQIGAIFVQPQFARQSAETIAGELGCPVMEIDPLAVDYYNNLLRAAQQISGALGQ